MLDAKYETGNYTSDNIDMYMSRTADDGAVRMFVTANEIYYFGYGTNNTPSVQPSQKAEEGESVTLAFTEAFSLNDPIRVYGASRMRKLETGTAGDQLVGNINLNKCTVLQELDMSTTGGGGDFYMNLDNCRQLAVVDLTNQSKVRTGSQASTELDFSNQTRLHTFKARGTTVKSVVFAQGAPLTVVQLPDTLTTLRLEYLPSLTMDGLTVAGYNNVETFVFSGCPGLDWQTLLGRCPGVKRLRVEGINMEGDGSLLARYMDMGGIDADGNATSTCGLTGTYRLTRYLDEATYETYRAHYPELNIRQPQYTMIEFDETISDEANVSNLDNGTGSKFGNDYVPSGHIAALRSRRFRCLSKVTTKPTSRAVTQAGQSVSVNNADGVATIYPLHDENSYYYADAENTADCTAAKLDGSQGDVMMYEPHRWTKGINDYLNGKKYACYSINDEMPDVPDVTVVLFDDIEATPDGYRKGYKLLSNKGTLAASYTADANFSVCKVPVSGYRKVRFPTVLGSNLMCSLFTDSEDNIVDTVVVGTLGATFEHGMYIIYDVPDNAESLYFTIYNAVDFDKVVLSNSDRIEDMEPDWVETDAYLDAVFGSSVVGTKLMSCITGGSTAASFPWTDFHHYSQQRGMQQTDWNMHNDIANLFYAFYGRRDSQSQCGAGSHSNTRVTGQTAVIGMQDTVNTNGTTVGGVEGNGLAYYKTVAADGTVTYTKINNTNCLGYEDIYGHKYGMLDNVEVNREAVNGVWTITQPDGSERRVKGSTSSDIWITGVVWGKYMDMIPAGNVSSSQSTKHCDKYYYAGSKSRVVYRGNNNAVAFGGVSYANASNDASNASTSIGSRLAFRGKIEIAPSVEAYESAKAFDE